MSGPVYPADAPPPEVPEEFAAAYREAYQRALESGPGDPDPFADLPDLPPQEVVLVGTHRSEHELHPTGSSETWQASRWFVPAALAVGALLLVGSAYGVGKALSGDDEPAATGTAVPQSSKTTGASDSPTTAGPDKAEPSTSPGGWDGAVTAVTVDAIATDCTAPASNDSSGSRVTYVPENATDGKSQTAWRCAGTAVGETLTLRLARDTDVAEVGLVPGYAKTDPESGVDRYAENNRITKVRWTLADGVTVVQRLDPDPSSRAMQLIRVPRTTTDTIELEILAVKHGPRNTTAISEISLSEAS
jgi:hypothetical protein